MGSVSISKLKERASLALRVGDLPSAIATYRDLEAREPSNPLWPRRRADAYLELAKHDEAQRALERVAELAIDSGDVIQAIAVCKEILELDPDHIETLDRLNLLYGEAGNAPPIRAVRLEIPVAERAPLGEILLTEALPGATPAGPDDLGDMGIAEIPLLSPASALNPVKPHPDGTKPRATGLSARHDELARTALFGSLSREDLQQLVEGLRLVHLEEGEILFRQGDPADTLFVVAEGAVIPIAEENGRRKLAVLEAGSFFGEIGLIANQPRNATIQAMVRSRLLAIDRKLMWKMIRSNAHTLQVMLEFLRDRLIDRLVRTHPFFAAFPIEQRREVAGLFRFLEAKTGNTLIDQGRPAESLYALLAGSVQVIQMDIDGDKVLATLQPGSIFGEMSLLGNEPAIASVVASEKCWLLALPKQRLDSLLERTPEAETIIANLAQIRRAENRSLFKNPIAEDDDSIGPTT